MDHILAFDFFFFRGALSLSSSLLSSSMGATSGTWGEANQSAVQTCNRRANRYVQTHTLLRDHQLPMCRGLLRSLTQERLPVLFREHLHILEASAARYHKSQ